MSENNNNTGHDPVSDTPTQVIQAPPPPSQNIPPPPPPPHYGPQAPGASGRAIASLVLAILSFVCCGFLAGIPAILLGRMEEAAINRGQAPEAGRTFAKIGWILGLVSTVLNCLMLMVWIAYMVLVGGAVGSGFFEALKQNQHLMP